MKKENFNRLIRRGLINKPPVKLRNVKSNIKNRDPLINILQRNINFSRLGEVFLFKTLEPYSSIIDNFIKKDSGLIKPIDSESSMFLSKIPYITNTKISILQDLLEKYGVVLLEGGVVLTCSESNILRSDVLVSIVCFSLYVKFFIDFLTEKETGSASILQYNFAKKTVLSELKKIKLNDIEINPKEKNIETIGKDMVGYGLVDSIFGNISKIRNNFIFISESGSYLDDLSGNITKIPLYGKFDPLLNPSSEYKIHREIFKRTNFKFIIHGHPIFSVIMSIFCNNSKSNLDKEKYIGDIPILTETSGVLHPELAIRVAERINERRKILLHGHGIFCAAENNFTQALNDMISTELLCMRKFLTVSGLSG